MEDLGTAGRDAAWSVTGQVSAGYLAMPSRVADGQPVEDPTQARLGLFLSTVTAGFSRRVGPGLEVQLPIGVISWTDIVNGTRSDAGLGDLEARGRYAHRFGPVWARAALGLALPTGPSIARSGEAAILENARYLTLGRGVTWALGDLDLRVALGARLSLFGQGTARVALGLTRDGFGWGPEVRGTLGLATGPFFERLSASGGVEVQWRAQSSEVDPFSSARVPSINTGGTWLTLTASVQVRLGAGLSAFVAGRAPVFQAPLGYQFVQSLGVFAGLGGSWEVISPRATSLAGTSGRVTLVEYGATWCEPCRRLEPLLAQTERDDPRVIVKRVDASDWTAEQLDAALPGVAGLPVLDLFDAEGRLVRRLVGEAVFEYNAVLLEVAR